MTEPCRNCGSLKGGSNNHDWQSICPDCGQLHWLRVDDIVECVITRLNQFGVFVELAEGVKGLIHVTELSSPFPDNPQQVVAVGELLRAKVIRIDYEQQTISLSVKRLN